LHTVSLRTPVLSTALTAARSGAAAPQKAERATSGADFSTMRGAAAGFAARAAAGATRTAATVEVRACMV
jgi:hypothetical protein